jgi:hypothetical protein
MTLQEVVDLCSSSDDEDQPHAVPTPGTPPGAAQAIETINIDENEQDSPNKVGLCLMHSTEVCSITYTPDETSRRLDHATAELCHVKDGLQTSDWPVQGIPDRIPLDANRGPYTVGREPAGGTASSFVHLDSPEQANMVSRQHALLSFAPHEGWSVLDLNSTNGLLLNSRRVAKAVLRDGIYALASRNRALVKLHCAHHSCLNLWYIIPEHLLR